jgi:uncharacterized caspase-like protein
VTDLRTPGSRAILIGASTYGSLTDLPAVADTVFDLRRALIERSGMARESIKVLLDPAGTVEVVSALAREARDARGVLVVYYAGHGLAGLHGDLYLAVARTDPGALEYTAVPYDLIRRELRNSRAQAVVILDCVFSGLKPGPSGLFDRGLDTLPPPGDGIAVVSAATCAP